MRWIFLFIFLLPTVVNAAPPATRPSPSPIEIPFKLTDTNHLLVRLKINGQGPFNFIVDTGSPAMILRVPVGQKLGLKPNSRDAAYLDKLEIEGGALLKHVMCIVETPYQIEGMNAVGASGVELDGLLGYSVLAKFRLQIDLSKDRMIWTPVGFDPPTPARPYRRRFRPSSRPSAVPPATQPAAKDEQEENEATLESAGGLLRMLGPLIKPTPVILQMRGFLGVELTADSQQVSVEKVLGNSPAAIAGIEVGDVLTAINDHPVANVAQAQQATARILAGQTVHLAIRRSSDLSISHVNIVAGEGL